MKVCGRPPAMTPTQAYFCRVMLERRRARQPCVHIFELCVKFRVDESTVRNQAAGKHAKHHTFEARR